jgi:signal transduction histidine kinase
VYVLLLLGFSGASLTKTSQAIEQRIASADVSYRRIDDTLEKIRLDISNVAVLLRDSLISWNSESTLPAIRDSQREIDEQVKLLNADTGPTEAAELRKMEVEIREYFDAVYKLVEGIHGVPRTHQYQAAIEKRQVVVGLAEHLSKLNDLDFDGKQEVVRASMSSLRSEILETITIALLLSTAAAGAGLYRGFAIEKENEAAHRGTSEARQGLENLSRRLVTAQENERKALSRELHDEIGQSLTALKLEISKSEKIARAEGSSSLQHLQTIREIADQVFSVSKNISLGLRPPMLDDLGLVAALNWYTDAFAKRSDIAVSLDIDGNVGELPESYRTCLFRIVQEALTNCARHSKATHVVVRIEANEDSLGLTVADDGVGFEAKRTAEHGLGLLSMRERSAELGGNLKIVSQPGQGTLIRVTIPYPVTAKIT